MPVTRQALEEAPRPSQGATGASPAAWPRPVRPSPQATYPPPARRSNPPPPAPQPQHRRSPSSSSWPPTRPPSRTKKQGWPAKPRPVRALAAHSGQDAVALPTTGPRAWLRATTGLPTACRPAVPEAEAPAEPVRAVTRTVPAPEVAGRAARPRAVVVAAGPEAPAPAAVPGSGRAAVGRGVRVARERPKGRSQGGRQNRPPPRRHLTRSSSPASPGPARR